MSKKSLTDILTSCGKSHPYGMPESRETEGRVPSGSASVKIRDRLFLVRNGNEISIYDGETGSVIKPRECVSDISLDGFKRELSFAPDVILQAEFGKETVRIGEEEFDIRTGKVSDKLLVIEFNKTEDIIVFDVSRFLLYASIDGRFMLGYMEV